MLTISYALASKEAKQDDAKQELEEGDLLFDGDYLDVYPLFKMAKFGNPNTFLSISKFRSDYNARVLKEIAPLESMKLQAAPKRIFYHKLLIKPMLYAFDLLELEQVIAAHWELPELPMLEQDQFDFWDISLVFRNHNGSARPESTVRVYKRRSDNWMNLTSPLDQCDGDDTIKSRNPSSAAKGKISMMRDIHSLTHSADEMKAVDEVLSVRTKTTDKKIFMEQYVTAKYIVGETWCHPTIWANTMMDMSIDFNMRSSEILLYAGSQDERELLKPSKFVSVTYMPTTKLTELANASKESIEAAKAEQKRVYAEAAAARKLVKAMKIGRVVKKKPVRKAN